MWASGGCCGPDSREPRAKTESSLPSYMSDLITHSSQLTLQSLTPSPNVQSSVSSPPTCTVAGTSLAFTSPEAPPHRRPPPVARRPESTLEAPRRRRLGGGGSGRRLRAAEGVLSGAGGGSGGGRQSRRQAVLLVRRAPVGGGCERRGWRLGRGFRS